MTATGDLIALQGVAADPPPVPPPPPPPPPPPVRLLAFEGDGLLQVLTYYTGLGHLELQHP